MRRLTLPALMAAALLAVVAGCTSPADPWPQGAAGPKVLVSFAPLYSFATAVAGEDATVRSLMSGRGPHGYEPTASDAHLLRKADVFFTVGLGLDDGVATKLKRTSGNARLKLVSLSDAIPEDRLLDGSCEHCKHDHAQGHGHDHAHEHGKDAHVWLGIPEAVRMVNAVRDELSTLDPAHKEGYTRRAAEYVAKLQAIEAEGKELLAKKGEKKLLPFHGSLSYFARTFGLELADPIQVDPGQEPSGAKLKELVQTCLKEKVRLIAVEPQFPSNTSAKAILEELKRQGVADAAFVEVDPIETAPDSELTPDLYEKRLRANLKNLADALK